MEAPFHIADEGEDGNVGVWRWDWEQIVESKQGTLALFCVSALFSCSISSAGTSKNSTRFSVCEYGAVGDGITNDTEAFHDAWNATCSSEEENPIIIVPENNTFLVHQVKFGGPCKAKNITFMILGNIIAPDSPKSWSRLDPNQWLVFSQVEQLHVTGFGTIDGRGQVWWKQSCRYHPDLEGCTSLAPTAMKFISCNASGVTNVNLVNSSQTHMLISGCHYFHVDNLLIEAPGDSPNTDGIHIQFSEDITITNTMIRTGDDCVSVGDYTSNINISSLICGPGHGVSIGSLGRSGNAVEVENIHVRKVYFEHTTNGARIKTWQVGTGYVRGVTFEDIKFDSVENPIIIDQYYCKSRGACEEKQTGVHISNVTYSDLSGTSSTDVAISLNCSRSVACKGIVLKSVNLTSTIPGSRVTSNCINAYGNVTGEVQPKPSLLVTNTTE
ncbi:probable polygalacturonase At1g80170 [Punica granatum]|uniref:endo-polygalacturonase n=1 Tax=Punica granatum TaxID=22663 RepID=A0A6P8CGG0_PUNGR|nr:probable polygalacturonase At1g80170 [Punica granatum]